MNLTSIKENIKSILVLTTGFNIAFSLAWFSSPQGLLISCLIATLTFGGLSGRISLELVVAMNLVGSLIAFSIIVWPLASVLLVAAGLYGLIRITSLK